MNRRHLGKQPPRYEFILNPYTDVRLSKCPRCQRSTFARKFALAIHIDDWGMIVLGKTCKYCAQCEIIMCHQNELEPELVNSPAKYVPRSWGTPPGYFVVGTMDKKAWKEGLASGQPMTGDRFAHLADFKGHLELHVSGGWGPAK